MVNLGNAIWMIAAQKHEQEPRMFERMCVLCFFLLVSLLELGMF
jgi:hypothetical protein